MLPRITVTVYFTDEGAEPVDVPIRMGAMVELERKYGASLNNYSDKMEYLLFLAHIQLGYNGVVLKTFDRWIRTVDTIGLAGGGDTLDETQ